MHQNSILRRLASYFIEEHVCAPPDARSQWIPVSHAASAGRIGIYECPDCGQRLARVGRCGAPYPVLFKSENAVGRTRTAA
jgi:hypothetical protein